jgi:hypothetical protein
MYNKTYGYQNHCDVCEGARAQVAHVAVSLTSIDLLVTLAKPEVPMFCGRLSTFALLTS